MNIRLVFDRADIRYLLGAAIFFTAVGLLLPAALLVMWGDKICGMRISAPNSIGKLKNEIGSKGEMA
jgi:hypothetical protein